MSLINCPECNKEISDTAKICPNCGKKLKVVSMPKYTVPIAIIGFFVLIFAVCYNFFGHDRYDLSPEAKSISIETLKITDNYLDGIIDSDAASIKLDDLKNKIDALNDNSVSILSLGNDIVSISSGIYLENRYDILKSRNELASSIGKKKIKE